MPTLNPTQNACIKSSCTPVQIFGGALHLDLQSQRMVSYLFDDRKSKVMLFVAKGQEEDQVLEYVLPLAKRHLETLKFVFANPSTTEVRCAPSQLLRNDFADGLSYFDASVGRVVGCMSSVTVDACLPRIDIDTTYALTFDYDRIAIVMSIQCCIVMFLSPCGSTECNAGFWPHAVGCPDCRDTSDTSRGQEVCDGGWQE